MNSLTNNPLVYSFNSLIVNVKSVFQAQSPGQQPFRYGGAPRLVVDINADIHLTMNELPRHLPQHLFD